MNREIIFYRLQISRTYRSSPRSGSVAKWTWYSGLCGVEWPMGCPSSSRSASVIVHRMALRTATAILCPGNCRSRPNRGHRMALRLASVILCPWPCPNQKIFEELLTAVSRCRVLSCPAAEPQEKTLDPHGATARSILKVAVICILWPSRPTSWTWSRS